MALFADVSSIDLEFGLTYVRNVSATWSKTIAESLIAGGAVIPTPQMCVYVAAMKKHTPQPINETNTNRLFPVDRMHMAPMTQPKNCAVPNRIVA